VCVCVCVCSCMYMYVHVYLALNPPLQTHWVHVEEICHYGGNPYYTLVHST